MTDEASAAAYQIPWKTCEFGDWSATLEQQREDGFTFFDFITAVDETDAEPAGFDVVAHLYDVTPGHLREIFVRTRVPDGQAIASVTSLWPGAAWHERETHEMFGIAFEGFTDASGSGLRPLLLPDGFDGTPLRKSFVLVARASKPWPGAKEPGGDSKDGKPARAPRRRMQPPGVPDESWGPR
ncbi:NADH-quinone oxidoreductase subunit C [Rudaeicoccus suwonensis]|uniref:NADH-quinone oxidoreductase subunit C n=1 Tax=Rudaeicoccus suwonensis TaxID=657409 RepID=A0A561E7J5_9MICO|nr:NADH-quinone oxidoreductase subunit C [Rudaeicoccus suwonensis]TWE11576.1 NADH-quinone oxidoreductase subunit C [Rudaeicoccus suwonensis]